MIAHHFEGQSFVMEVSPKHDHERDGEVYGLPVRVERDEAGRAWGYSSMWKPTPEELALLNAGGAVRVTVVGAQPPIDVGAEAAPLLVSA